MKDNLLFIFKIIVVLTITGLVGFAMLCFVYIIPTDIIVKHLSGTMIFAKETEQYEYAAGYKGAILDNTTDAIMLGEAAYCSGNIFEDASVTPRISYEDSEPVFSLLGVVNRDSERAFSIVHYSRYWHGYLIILKPFLYFFDYADLRMFNLAGTLLLSFAIILSLYRSEIYKRYTLAIIVMLVFWNIYSIGMCLQYSSCFYISIISTLVLISRSEDFSANACRKYIFFLFIGMVTSYFDFLTYPIVTLGLPLTVYVLYNKSKSNIKNIRECLEELIDVIKTTIIWSIGYLGYWLEKWIIGSVFSAENVLKDAYENIMLRTGTEVGGDATNQISRLEIIAYLLRVSFGKWLYVFMFGAVFMCLIYRWWQKRNELAQTRFAQLILNRIVLLFIGLYPVFWYFMAANHSYVHPRIVYRALGLMIFAWISMFLVPVNVKKG